MKSREVIESARLEAVKEIENNEPGSSERKAAICILNTLEWVLDMEVEE